MEIRQGFPVGCVCSQRLETLVMKQTAVEVVCARLGNHIDHAAGGSSKLRRRSCGNHLKFLNRLQCDIYSRTLATRLFAEEAIVVVAAIKTDVVEYPALAGKADLVA